jgi:hypothetical protein
MIRPSRSGVKNKALGTKKNWSAQQFPPRFRWGNKYLRGGNNFRPGKLPKWISANLMSLSI